MMQKLFTAGLIVLFLMITVVAALLVFDRVRQIVASSNNLPSWTQGGNKQSSEVGQEPGNPLPIWTGTERVNVLVMGIDQRAGEEGPWRTDTMLVLTIDPVTMSAGMLSIPRDLWVPMPPPYSDTEGRINTAHYLGAVWDYPGGGPALAAKTVQNNLGVPIHHYARVNFTAFEELVDLIGGIDIEVEEEINDPKYPSSDPADPYGVEHLYIPAGKQHFNGEMALKYARSRHGSSDFDRARRQQQVLMAIFDRITRLDMLPQLAPQAPEMWRTLHDSVVTDPDLSLDEIIALAHLASKVDPEDVRSGVMDEGYTQFWETPDGQQVLIPIRDQMRELRDYIFTAEEPASEAEEDAPQTQLEDEAATVEVLNGTLMTGLAADVTGLLQQEGLQVEHTGNADRSDVEESLVVAHAGKTYTAEYIARLLNLPPTAVVNGSDPAADYDVSVILGADYKPSPQ